jgi:TRAP-type C4-dicarboxylate transport system substrate-binding protein
MEHRHLIAVAAAGILVSTATLARAADPITFKFAYPAPPQGWLATKGADPWIKKVEAASGGLLEIKLYGGATIANFRNVYDRLLSGVAEVAFGTFGVMESEFPRTTVAGLPFLANSSSEAGLALWRLYESGVIAEEYARVKPLAMFGFGATALYMTKPITKLEDLQGVKIFANGRSVARIMVLIGAVPVTSNSGELYQGLNRGLAEGTAFTWSGVQQFKLVEVIKHHVEMPFGKTGGYFFMNKDAYARLPEKARQAVDANSGEVLTKIVTNAADEQDAIDRRAVLAMPGQTTRPLSAAERARLEQTLAPLTQEWVAATADGAKVLAAFRAALTRIRAGS